MAHDRLRYFAACNSEAGFYSFYNRVFSDDLAHIYIIKGGPGTGKSSLMRRVADRAEACGWIVEEVYCSSDPASLDGIIARDPYGKSDFAVLDGTAPHITEMTLPGARDEIWYVGEFWSSEALSGAREEIFRAYEERRAAYRRLYRYLQAAGQCERVRTETAEALLDSEKLTEAVSDILSRYPTGKGFSQKTMLTSSLGMRGRCRFDTFETYAETVFGVRDVGGLSHRLYDEIYRQAKRRQMPIWVSYDPLIPTRIDSICLPTLRLAFVPYNGEREMRRLSLRRCLDQSGLRNVAPILATAEKCRDRLMETALNTLEEIRIMHFDLEARYVAAMDFEAMQAQTERWLARILP